MEQAQRELRRQGIGGSDIAAICGLNPWRNAHDLWQEKVYPEGEDQASEAAYWGLQFEDLLCLEYARRKNVRLSRLPVPYGIVRDATDPWIQGSPDRMVDGIPVGFDAKMAGLRQSNRWGPEGSDQIPDEYLLQCQWYLRLLGAERWDLGVLLGQEYRIYEIHPHKDLQRVLVDIAARFWFKHVIPKVPPDIDHSDGARRLLDKLYPLQRDEIRPATDGEVALARELRQVTQRLQEAEMSHARLRNLLCNQIALAEGIAGPGFKVTWKRSKDSAQTDWEAAFRDAVRYANLMPPEVENMIGAHTMLKPGQRRFRSTFQAEEEG